MPTVVLQLGPIELWGPKGYPHTQSAIVGDPATIWSDTSDDTYAKTYRGVHTDGTWSGSDEARGLSVVPLTVPPSSITAAELTVRVSGTAPSVSVVLNANDGVAYTYERFTLSGTGVQEFTTSILDQPDWEDPLTTLTAPASQNPFVQAYIPGPEPFGTYALFHFVEYRVTYTSHAPWLRQYPRSSRRLWPPERSYQRSIRRAGGYL